MINHTNTGKAPFNININYSKTFLDETILLEKLCYYEIPASELHKEQNIYKIDFN